MTEKQHKKVLFMTFDFPPARTSAVYRMAGITKYLPSFGWIPLILTVNESVHPVQDPSLLAEYPPDIEIVRTGYSSIDAWEKCLVTFKTALRGNQTAVAANQTAASVSAAPAIARPLSLTKRMLRRIDAFIASLLYFPDRTVGWVPYVVLAARRLLRSGEFAVYYTSGPPRSGLLAGLILKWWTGHRWIAEFRDPWYPPEGRPIRNFFERWLFRRFVKNADGIVLISNGLAEELMNSFGADRGKISVVSNGFDEAEYARVPAGRVFPEGLIHFAHFGTVYPEFGGKFFLAWRELLQADLSLKDRVRVHIVGFPDDTCKSFAASPDVGAIMQIHEFMPQPQALQAMRSSDVLLLFLGGPQTSRLSGLGKIFWYLRVGKPILATAYPGDCQRLIERARAGVVVSPDDLAGIKSALLQFLNEHRSFAPDPEVVASLRYDRLAGKLAAVLDKVTTR